MTCMALPPGGDSPRDKSDRVDLSIDRRSRVETRLPDDTLNLCSRAPILRPGQVGRCGAESFQRPADEWKAMSPTTLTRVRSELPGRYAKGRSSTSTIWNKATPGRQREDRCHPIKGPLSRKPKAPGWRWKSVRAQTRSSWKTLDGKSARAIRAEAEGSQFPTPALFRESYRHVDGIRQ